MKDLFIKNSYHNSLERITDRNSFNSAFGDVSNFSGPSGRAVYTPYTNFQKGTLSTGYDGREFFTGNYNMGPSIHVKRGY